MVKKFNNLIILNSIGLIKFMFINLFIFFNRTPLHCAASCNNLPMVIFLVEHGACIFATTLSDHETAAVKCEEDEEGFDGCSEYLYSKLFKLFFFFFFYQ